jgi:exosome complex exonuclease RRP6
LIFVVLSNMSEPKRAKFVVDHFAKQVFGLSVAATKVSNSLPDDREEIAAMAVRAPELAERLTALQKKLVGLMRETGAKRKKGSLLSANGSVDDVFEHVVDVSDLWLEAVDRTVDRLNRVTSTVGPLSVTREVVKKSSVIRAANVLRPQMRFVPAVDNSAGVVFVPHLWSKPNAIVPLADMFRPSNSIAGRELETAISSALRGHLTARISTDTVVANPYETELLALEFLPHQLEAGAERLYGKLEQTPREWIDTPAALDILVGKLAQEKEIAVDLEQHFFRSYQGFVCLMQLSTRNQNFLIDTLELRSSMQKLNVIFTNPKIIKVFVCFFFFFALFSVSLILNLTGFAWC